MAQNGAPQLQIRLRQHFRTAPFETVDEAVGDAFKLCRRTVAREDELAVGAVQIVENGEEGIHGALLAAQLLHIVNQQHINALIEVDEVGHFALLSRHLILILEISHAHKQHPRFRMPHFYGYGNGLDEVSLANTHRSVEEERIEVVALGLVGNGAGYGVGQPVALANTVIGKRIGRIQPRRLLKIRTSRRRGILAGASGASRARYH